MSKMFAENNGLPDLPALRMAQLEPYRGYLYGNRFASILAIKAMRGEAEEAGQAPFFGVDGAALESAFEKLGWGANSWCGVLLEPLGLASLSAEQLRLLIEIIDPLALVVLDKAAQTVLANGFTSELQGKKLEMGKKTGVLGRPLLTIDNFESALTSLDPQRKQLVWLQLKALKKS